MYFTETSGVNKTGGIPLHTFNFKDRNEILRSLFLRQRSVTYKQVENLLERKSIGSYHVQSGQGEYGFESKLSSYYFFCHDVFKVEELPEQDVNMVESIILWNTLFEDRNILKEKIKQAYGDRLSNNQIKIICRKRFAGWGKLSRKFLKGLKENTDSGSKTIIDILYEGDPNNDHIGRAMNLQQILADKKLSFRKQIDDLNQKYFEAMKGFDLNEVPGSQALRRTINQALKIAEEIEDIAGRPPARIYLENTRSDDLQNTGKRTQRRYRAISEALQAFKNEYGSLYDGSESVISELESFHPNDLDDKRLALYFMQNGKSLYSGKRLDISQLTSYQIDHIIPQSYIKDDSFENLALVLPSENQNKNDALLIDRSIRRKMKSYWEALYKSKLIGDKKYRNLLASNISEDRIKGFVSRQLVETSQIVKLLQLIFTQKYPDTTILGVKASISSELRDALDLAKCREANDFHHAHDAFIAAQIGRFLLYRYSRAFSEPGVIAGIFQRHLREEWQRNTAKGKCLPRYSFFIQSFLTSGFDSETGEVIKDHWDAKAEVAQIKRSINFHDCHITRMLEQDSGAFWDDTIYSPHSNKRLTLPVKRDLTPERYGGFSREQFSYFSIVRLRNRKTKKESLDLAAIPTSMSKSLEGKSDDKKKEYLERLYKHSGEELICIVKQKILKQQVFELNGARYYLTGKKEARNGNQLAFSILDYKLLKDITKGKELTNEQYRYIINSICTKYRHYAPKLSATFGIDNIPNELMTCDSEDRNKIILDLLSIANAEKNRINLSAIGGSANAGNIRFTYKKELSDTSNDFVLIHQSTTGLFENRERIGL